MKKLAFPLILAFCLYAAAQSNVLYLPPAPKPMTVQDVIKLSKAGLSDDTIIEQIRAKNQRFDLSADQLVQLKTANVSERVIQAMIDPGVRSTTTVSTPTTGKPAEPATPVPTARATTNPEVANTPSWPTEVGVYFKSKGTWSELLPEIVNWKTGGVGKSVATAGIVKGDLNGHVNGSSSPNRLTTPIQLLVVTPEGTAITEYQLLRLHQHGSNREFRSVTGGVFHVSGGATRDLMQFEGNKVATRTYTVNLTPAEGQYGLLPPGAYTSANAASTGKIYSFGVIE